MGLYQNIHDVFLPASLNSYRNYNVRFLCFQCEKYRGQSSPQEVGQVGEGGGGRTESNKSSPCIADRKNYNRA